MAPQHSGSGIGSHKHGISGHVHNSTHFTGRKKKAGKHRKTRRTHRERQARRGTHVNKYEESIGMSKPKPDTP